MDAPKGFVLDPYPDPSHPLPRPVIIGGLSLMVAAVLLCAGARATGVGVTAAPAPVPVASRDLSFADGDDGVLTVMEAGSGRVVSRFPAGEAGFVRATVRGLVRNRTRHGEPGVGDFRISADRDGGVWLQDLGTRQNVDLRAFGPTQVQAFAQFLGGEAAP